jgi:hypothetical protein
MSLDGKGAKRCSNPRSKPESEDSGPDSPTKGISSTCEGGGNSSPSKERDLARMAQGWAILNKFSAMCKEADVPCIAVLTRCLQKSHNTMQAPSFAEFLFDPVCTDSASFCRGEPGSAFVDAAESHDCDLAVLGSRYFPTTLTKFPGSIRSHTHTHAKVCAPNRCLGAIKRAVFSSVSSHVLRHMHCPVLVYRCASFFPCQTYPIEKG